MTDIINVDKRYVNRLADEILDALQVAEIKIPVGVDKVINIQTINVSGNATVNRGLESISDDKHFDYVAALKEVLRLGSFGRFKDRIYACAVEVFGSQVKAADELGMGRVAIHLALKRRKEHEKSIIDCRVDGGNCNGHKPGHSGSNLD